MKAAPFSYLAAESADEAVAALVEHGDAAKLLAGGQSLLTLMNLRVAQPEVLIDIGRCGLDAIHADERVVRIGATTTQSAALASSAVGRACPLLRRALLDVSHQALRNRGTVGGSIAHADPAAEIPAVVLACDGVVTAQGPGGERRIAADAFFLSHYTTVLEEDEVLTHVELPSREGRAWAFYEVARRRGDFALAGVAATFDLDGDGRVADPRIVLFGVDERPVRARAAEAALAAQRLEDRTALADVAAAAAEEVHPLGGIHGSASHRRRLAQVAVRRALEGAVARKGAAA